jgi:hypothetical protein
VRVTWVQPEDLVGHELRQSREEGKDVDTIEARWLAAGGAPAPPRGASPDPVAPELRRLALELLDELDALPRPWPTASPRASTRSSRSALRRRPWRPTARSATRVAAAWLGRAGGLRARKPVEGLPREGIRAIAEGTGNWPVRGWFTAEGLAPKVSERLAWNRASRPTSLAENINGVPEDDDLNFTFLGLLLLERAGTSFDSLDVAKLWLDFQPPGRIFTAERVAARNLLEAYLPPETATRRNPFRSGSGPGCASMRTAGRPPATRSQRRAWRGRTPASATRRTGVYAAMFMARRPCGVPLRVLRGRLRRHRPLGRAVAQPARRVASGGTRPGPRHPWEEVVDALYARDGHYHWVHAINNTALTAAALYAFDGDFSGGICAAVQGGLDTGHERRRGGLDPRRARGCRRHRRALDGAARGSVRKLAAGLRRNRHRRAGAENARRRRRLMALPVEQPRDPWAPRPIDLPTQVPLEPGLPLDALDAAKIFAAPDDPAEWPAWREALKRWRSEAAARVTYDDGAYRLPEFAWTQGCFSVALVWLWDELLYDHAAARFTPERFCDESEGDFGGSTASSSGMPIR